MASEVFEDGFLGVGLVVLLGWTQEDALRSDLEEAENWLLSKTAGLRVFPDEEGRMNLSLEKYLQAEQIDGGVLWVPQFTLAGRLDSGFRPSFTKAMDPAGAKKRFDAFTQKVKDQNFPFKSVFGIFGADMELSFTNWGPVSLMLEK